MRRMRFPKNRWLVRALIVLGVALLAFERVAPLSWWITEHVDDGRAALNFSDFSRHHGDLGDSTDTISSGSMPPSYYTWLGLHSNAQLTKADKQQLIDGLRKTYAAAGIKGG